MIAERWRVIVKDKKSKLRSFLETALTIFLALIVLFPLGIYSVMAMGFPPIVGNLAAAQAMKKYAAQIYPEWKAEGSWAGYNLVVLFQIDGAQYHQKAGA